MKFGVREIVNVVFRAKNTQKIGNAEFKKGQPVFYLDSAKTSTLEGAATTVYATGGRGNTRLIAWEGERTLTFTVEDALISPVSFAMLSGAGVFKGQDNPSDNKKVHFHQTTTAVTSVDGTTESIDLTDALGSTEKICNVAPIFVMNIDAGGDLTGGLETGFTVSAEGTSEGKVLTRTVTSGATPVGAVIVDYYVIKNASDVTELQIDAETFGGYYYVEADTLFRRQYDGKDLPANITLPNVKIQSNFTFSMAATGDPSTFTFTMDAMPGYTYFDTTKKVLCAIQYVDDKEEKEVKRESVFPHAAKTPKGFIEESKSDSVQTQSVTVSTGYIGTETDVDPNPAG